MSLYNERVQEGYGQAGSPRIRVDYMPDESQEGHLSGPNPNTTHSKFGNLIRAAARSRVGRVVASLGLLGSSVAAPTAIDAARAFAEGPSNRAEAMAASDTFKNLASTDPMSAYLDVAHVDLIRDPNTGKVMEFLALANQLSGVRDPNKWRIFNSTTIASGEFTKFTQQGKDFSGNPSMFHRDGGKFYIANDEGVATSSAGIYVFQNSFTEPRIIIQSHGRVDSKAVFEQARILAFGKAGDGGSEVALVNMDTEKYNIVKPEANGKRAASYIQKGPVSSDGKTGTLYTSPGHGFMEVDVDLESLTLKGAGKLSYSDRKANDWAVVKDNTGKATKVLLFDNDRNELFIADHANNQEIMKYRTPRIAVLIADEKNIAAVTRNGGWCLEVWPTDVNRALNPEKVTTIRLLDGFIDPQEEVAAVPKEEIYTDYINGEFFYFVNVDGKGIIAVKADANGVPLNERYMLENGILISYSEQASPTVMATAIVSSTPTSFPTSSPISTGTAQTTPPPHTPTASSTPTSSPTSSPTPTGNSANKVYIPLTARNSKGS